MTKILLLTVLIFISFQGIYFCQAERGKRGNNANSATKPGEEQTTDTDTTKMIEAIINYLADWDPENPLTEEGKIKYLSYLDSFDLSKVPSAGLHLAAIYYWYDFKDTVMAEKYFLAGIQNRPDSILGLALDSYGDFLKEKKDYDSSIIVLKKSLEISEKLGDFSEAYETALTLGIIFAEIKSDFKESLKYNTKSLDFLNNIPNKRKLFEKSEESKKYAELYARIGVSYIALGIFDKGKDYLVKVLNMGMNLSSNMYFFLLIAYNGENNMDSARYCIDRILESDAVPELKMLCAFSNMGFAIQENDIIKKTAIIKSIQSINLNKSDFNKNSCFHYIARAIQDFYTEHKNYKYYLNKSDSIALTNRQYDDLNNSLLYRSYLHYYDGEIDTAFKYLDSCIKSMDKLLLEISDSDVATTFISFDASLILTSLLELGIQNFEQKKDDFFLKRTVDLSEIVTARSTLDMIRISKLYSNISNSTISTIDSLQTEIVLLNNNIKSASNQNILDSLISKRNELYENYDYTLDRNYSILYKSNLGEFRPVTLTMIQDEVLNQNTIVVKYFIGRDSCYVISFDKSNLWYYRLPHRKEIELNVKAIRNFYRNYKQNISAEIYLLKNNSYKLYQYLLEPIADEIKGKHLIIIPDNILYYLPFELLISDTSNIRDLRNVNFLIKNNSISYSPSLSLLFYLNKINKTDSKDLLLVGKSKFSINANPDDLLVSRDFSGQLKDISDLPGVVAEMDGINSIFDKEFNVNVLLNENAKEEKLKECVAKPYQLIHFATHGIVDDYGPQYCSLLLEEINSTTEMEDGYLQAFEISDLDIHSNLIVLSACNTALGKLYSGDGMKGLSQSFFIAGARSLCLTLWSISDFSTSEFMSNFYSGIDSSLPYIRALQQAKIKFIESDKYNSPYYWAPYIISGATN